jgi:molecular chaperone DnaJ
MVDGEGDWILPENKFG